MTKLPANLIISRSSSSHGPDLMHISVSDERSGCRLVELNFSLEEFCKALTSSYGKGEMEYYENCPVGKKRVSKTEFIVQPKRTFDANKDAKIAATALSPFEVDGWKGDYSDLWNHHNKTVDGRQFVKFHRYVDWEEQNEADTA